MGWIDIKYNYKTQEKKIILKPYKTDLEFFKVVKIRHPVNCLNCGKKLPKGTRVYGNGWIRACLECGDSILKDCTQGIKEVLEIIKENEELKKINKEKWEAENVLASL